MNTAEARDRVNAILAYKGITVRLLARWLGVPERTVHRMRKQRRPLAKDRTRVYDLLSRTWVCADKWIPASTLEISEKVVTHHGPHCGHYLRSYYV